MSSIPESPWAKVKARPGEPAVTENDVQLATDVRDIATGGPPHQTLTENWWTPAHAGKTQEPSLQDQAVAGSLADSRDMQRVQRSVDTLSQKPDKQAIVELAQRVRKGRQSFEAAKTIRRIIDKVESLPSDEYQERVKMLIDNALLMLQVKPSETGIGEEMWGFVDSMLDRAKILPAVRQELKQSLRRYVHKDISEEQLRNYDRYKPQVVAPVQQLGM